MATNYQWAKLGCEGIPKIIAAWIALATFAGSIWMNVNNMATYVPEREAIPAIRVIEDKPYNEIVIPTHEPHTHQLSAHSHPEILKELDERLKAHKDGSLH